MSFLDEIKQFSASKLQPTTTVVTTPDGRQLLEKHDSRKGRRVVEVVPGTKLGFVGDVKPDLHVAEVLPGLVMGSQDVAGDLDLLEKHKVTHILNVASMIDNLYEHLFTYKKMDILDLPTTDITQYFKECFQFISQGRDCGCVLVHCNAGVSRSATIVIAYLMHSQNMDFQKAFDFLKSKRQCIRPNDGFLQQLKHYNPSTFQIDQKSN